MAIDSKFLSMPIAESAPTATKRARLRDPVKGHADAITKNNIVPEEGTLDVALMFVPSETVYYELLQTSDNKGQPLDAYCRDKHVIAVSPNTLYAHLCVIAMGLRGMQMEENAKRLLESLSGMEKQRKIRGQVRNSGHPFEETPSKATASPTNSSREPGTLSKPCSAPVFPNFLSRIPPGTLPLPPEASIKKSA